MNKEEYAELSEYVHAEGTEIGDYLCSLLCLRDFTADHGMSEAFSAAVDTELSGWLETFREKTILETVTEPQPDRVYKAIVWLDDE